MLLLAMVDSFVPFPLISAVRIRYAPTLSLTMISFAHIADRDRDG